MANYATLKSAIQQVVKTNGNNEITGALLQQSLLAMVNSLGANYQFAGVAIPSTTPGTPDQNIFYIAGPGLYPNFNNTNVPMGSIGIFKYNGNWDVQTVSIGDFAGQIENLTKDVLDNITSWSTNTQYVVGDIRKYNNLIYRCKTNHTATTTFIPTYWEQFGLYKFISENANHIIDLQALNGNAKYQNQQIVVAQSGKYRNASGDIITLASASISAPIQLLAGQSLSFTPRSNLASFSALSLVTANGDYIKTLFLGNAGKIQYIATEDCFLEISDLNGLFTQGQIYIIENAILSLLPSFAQKSVIDTLQAQINTAFSLIDKSKMLEHLSDPFVKTTIHLFGDSITQGQGSSDYSPTGAAIPNYPTIHRNVGKKSYAALFASQVNKMYARDIWVGVASSPKISCMNGTINREGNFQTGNANGRIYVQFEFTGTQFVLKVYKTMYGGIFKIFVDNVENTTVDLNGNNEYEDVTISGLSNSLHTVQFIGTGTKSQTTSVNALYFSSIKLTKQVDVIDDGIVGHQSTATNGVVYTNSTTDDNFIIWMSGTNDRINGYWETANSVIGIYTWLRANRPQAEIIFMAASPCGESEFDNPVYVCHMDDINAAIARIAKQLNVTFISHYEYLTRYCRERGESITLISSDHVHPNDLGHMLIYQNICKNLGISADSDF